MFHRCAAALWPAILTTAAAAQAPSSFTLLSNYDSATGVSDNYTVLLHRPGGDQGAVRLPDGTIQPVGFSAPVRISADGRAVTANPSGTPWIGFLSGTYTPIPAPAGATGFPVATSISGDGTYVLGVDPSLHRPWRWSAATSSVFIPITTNVQALDISRDGARIIGSTADSTGRAFVFDTTTNMTTFVTPPPPRANVEFRRFFGNGQSVVGYQFTGGSTGQVGEAFKWSLPGGFAYLPPIPCPRASTTNDVQSYRPDAVSGDGSVVAGTQGGRAWIWTAQTGTLDLAHFLTSVLNLNIGDVLPVTVWDISADGHVLVGQANDTPGGFHGVAFMAVIPTVFPPVPPDVFSLASPANGSVAVPPVTTLSWTALANTTNYRVSITPTGSATTVFNTLSTSLELPAGLLSDCQAVTWSVVAANPCGQNAPSNGPATFHTLLPADFNHDGAADVADIFGFLSAWFAGDPRADINQMNGLTLADIFAFLDTFFTGCR